MRIKRHHQGQRTGSLQPAASGEPGIRQQRQGPQRTGQVQRRCVPLEALLEGDTCCVGSPGRPRGGESDRDQTYCAVLVVSSVNFALRSAEEQEAIIASFSGWLNALSFDVQILVRVLPLSLEPYLQRPLRSLSALRAATTANAEVAGQPESTDAQHESPIRRTATDAGARGDQRIAANGSNERVRTRTAWIELIEDHVQFVRELARQRRLLDRHFYLIIPADGDAGQRDSVGLVSRLTSLGRSARTMRSGILRHGEERGATRLGEAAERIWQRQNAARHQLDLRVTEVARQLGRMGISARRLRGRELVQLYYSCLTPRRATRHPLSEQVFASAGIPVTAVRVGESSNAGGTSDRQTGPSAAADSTVLDAHNDPPAANLSASIPIARSAPLPTLELARDSSGVDGASSDAGDGHPVAPVNLPISPPKQSAASRPASTSRRFVTVLSDDPSEATTGTNPRDQRRRRPFQARRRPTPSKHTPAAEAIRAGDLCIGLADLIAPASVELARDHLCLEDEYARALAVTGYPRHVYPGWLSRLIDADVPLEVVLHIHPRDARAAMLRLRKRLVEFQSSRLLDQKAGKLPDTEREIAFRDIEQLQEQLQRGDTRVFDLSLYILVRGASLSVLDQRTEQIQMALDNLLLVGRPVPYEQDVAFTSCLPEAQDRLRRGRLLDTGSVATAFPFSSGTLSMQEGILYGTVPRNGSLIILDPFSSQLENANAVVFAQSGAGKSYACKLQALRSLASGIAVTIVDPEDEYRRLCQAVGGQYIRLSPSSSQRLNPFDLFVPSAPLAGAAPTSDVAGTPVLAREDEGEWDPLAEKIQALHTLLDLMLADHGPGLPGSLTQREKGLLDRALYETYRQAGITPDPSTHTRSAPLLRDLYRVFRGKDFREQDTTGLADRLHRWVEGSLARMFSAPTNVRLDSPFVVFNIRDMDAELKPIGLALITDSVWTRMRRERGRLPRLFFIDEAWTLMQFPEGGRFLSSLARRARKYYLGLVTITQDVQDFLTSEWGQTVLAQSAIKLLMKQDPSTIETVGKVFRLSQGERQFVLGCNKGEGLLFARGAHVALRVEASPREHALATTNPRELAAMEARDARMAAQVDGGADHLAPLGPGRAGSLGDQAGQNGHQLATTWAAPHALGDLPTTATGDLPEE